MIAYGYDEKTYEYTGTQQCQLDPLESQLLGHDVWLTPSSTTLVQPPQPDVGRVAVWHDDKWNIVDDNRGKEYWLPEDKFDTPARVMAELGPLPEGARLERPAKTRDELAAELRAYRDGLIASNRWILERHSDELAAEGTTTLSKEQYRQWLGYMQALRDLPKQEGFPWDGGGEHTPWPERPS